MLIHGKERRFMLTVGASMDIADLCPHGDITKGHREGQLCGADEVDPQTRIDNESRL